MDIIRPVLHHVTLKTCRLDAMVDWYRLVIGAEVTFRNGGAAWLTNDGANHRIAFLALPGLADDPEKPGHAGLHHSAFEYADFGALMASFARLRDARIEPAFSLDHGMTVSLYYRDPDGNFVELQSDAFGDWQASSAWMRDSPDFAANPIGVFFDPGKVFAAFAAGRTLIDLQPKIRAGGFAPEQAPTIA